jgi:hypothetical protein
MKERGSFSLIEAPFLSPLAFLIDRDGLVRMPGRGHPNQPTISRIEEERT